MIPSVKTRAYRKLRTLTQFKFFDGTSKLPQLEGCSTPLAKTEEIIGAYENTPGEKQDLVLVTNLGLHWWTRGDWHSLEYSEMLEAEWPSPVKMEATAVLIRSRSGNLISVPIRGGTEFTRDAFSVMTFIMRMIEDEGRRALQKRSLADA